MIGTRALHRKVKDAVKNFWATRDGQATRQSLTGRRDQGARGAVTGGKQMDGFVNLIRQLIVDCGLSADCIHTSSLLELPGYFRAEKKWDLVVVDNGVLVAATEFKSQIGPSFGNNFNNRTEEAIGTAQDIWTAYREGGFRVSERPWLGYLMMLEDCPRSTMAVALKQPHFPAFPEFVGASYAMRYQLLLTKLVRERLYDSACFLMSSPDTQAQGDYSIPNEELSFIQFALALTSRVTAHLNAKSERKR